MGGSNCRGLLRFFCVEDVVMGGNRRSFVLSFVKDLNKWEGDIDVLLVGFCEESGLKVLGR